MSYESEWKISEITPELESLLDRRLTAAIAACQDLGDPINYRNVITTAMTLGETDRSLWLVSLPFNEDLLYDYIKRNQELYGIRLYSEEILSYLDIEPGSPHLHELDEEVGRFFIDMLPAEIFQGIQTANTRPTFRRLDQCERGIVGALTTGDNIMVVKYTLSSEEAELAQELGQAGLAPKVYAANANTLVEEFVEDPQVADLTANPIQVGTACGTMLGELHRRNIIYDNNMFGHIRVGQTEEGSLRVRIIDLETAHRGSDYQQDLRIANSEISILYKGDRVQERQAVDAMRLSYGQVLADSL